MPDDDPAPTETTSLLSVPDSTKKRHSLSQQLADDLETGSVHSLQPSSSSILTSLSKEEHALALSTIGERLPYNSYTTIDSLHDLVKDSFRLRSVRNAPGIRAHLYSLWDAASGWVAAALIGVLTACVAFLVDVAVATTSDWKTGYCTSNVFASREVCCTERAPLTTGTQGWGDGFSGSLSPWTFGADRSGSGHMHLLGKHDAGETCLDWRYWSDSYAPSFAIYVAFALAFGVLSGSVTLLTRRTLPAAAPGQGDRTSLRSPLHEGGPAVESSLNGQNQPSEGDGTLATGDSTDKPESTPVPGKTMYMAAGSGIPEIKTVLSGFVIPHFLDLRVLVVKAVGSIFAVSTGMCLGKEGPFVHISTCVAYLVGSVIPKYRDNGRKMRELLSAGCASGLSVAFGAPIGGVLFSYEEISTYFPRKVLWRAFLCSLTAAITLKHLNPTGTGKLVLFETNYGTSYAPQHYAIFVLLGVAGGVFGGMFCKLNFLWSRHFRKFAIIKDYPVFEVFLVVLATALLQYPNPVTREPGDMIIKNLLVDCRREESAGAWVCMHEAESRSGEYIGWLVYGTLVKLVLTTITFGIKVPSGIIIPALDGGAFFGRLIGQFVTTISPGIFAMVGAVAFLAGVSRMTISLAVVMFELTGELEYVIPYMIGILVAKWVADWLEPAGVYDLAQTVLGHPFLDGEHALNIAQRHGKTVDELVPPIQTMREITVEVPSSGLVPIKSLQDKLHMLKRRGLMDAGLVLVREGRLLGYLSETELEGGLVGLEKDGDARGSDRLVRLIKTREYEIEEDLVAFVDKTPMTIAQGAPMEFAVEMFSKLGLRHLCIVDEVTGKLSGVVIKKRLLDWLHRHND